METALYSAAVAQEDIMQGAEEERAYNHGFLVADTNQQLTLEQMEQKIDALDLYVRQHVKTKGLMLLLKACLQWGQVYSSCQPDLQTKLHTKPGYPACTTCDGLDCSVPPSVVAL